MSCRSECLVLGNLFFRQRRCRDLFHDDQGGADLTTAAGYTLARRNDDLRIHQRLLESRSEALNLRLEKAQSPPNGIWLRRALATPLKRDRSNILQLPKAQTQKTSLSGTWKITSPIPSVSAGICSLLRLCLRQARRNRQQTCRNILIADRAKKPPYCHGAN